jgi:hypothetical protein
VSPVKFELGFYIPEDGILHSHSHGNIKSHKGKLPTRHCMCWQQTLMQRQVCACVYLNNQGLCYKDVLGK